MSAPDLAGLQWVRHEAPDLGELDDDTILTAIAAAWARRSARPWHDALTDLRATTGRQEGPTGIPWRLYERGRIYYDGLPCPMCRARARAGGCGRSECPLLTFRGAGLPHRAPWESNHPIDTTGRERTIPA